MAKKAKRKVAKRKPIKRKVVTAVTLPAIGMLKIRVPAGVKPIVVADPAKRIVVVAPSEKLPVTKRKRRWWDVFSLVGVLALALPVLSSPADAQGRHRGWDRGGGWEQPRPDVGRIIGRVIGGAIEATRPRYYPPPQPTYGDEVEYCIQRFRSYNPETGFYRGYDGLLRRCP